MTRRRRSYSFDNDTKELYIGEQLIATSANVSLAVGSAETTTGAIFGGNAYVGTAVYISGKEAATLDDATALSIALGG